ncbi:thioredoxin fold domain-containing protein [Geomonas sp. Red32]|uniref:thioredoxin fold domain-containing protein n=1 Tax=Geomonas sp. Red32 TaxID=2912856 RepID=UPI00202CCE3F|nr:thioredoxin fold domain-containing protein [Geomonas sp. Red32]MCM0082554.1 thioredoxin fold domain-containing protein [Geomonas sp. Red32]
MKTPRHLITILAALLFGVTMAGAAWGAESLDLDKAVKVGSGKIMVIEFTDPDCPHCRKAEAYFQGKPQVTRYIFFLPLAIHPGAKEKVQYILSAKDRERAYLEVQSGKYDPRTAVITPEGIRLQKEHQEIAKKNKVRSTPTFMIYGRIMTGFDINRIDPLLR